MLLSFLVKRIFVGQIINVKQKSLKIAFKSAYSKKWIIFDFYNNEKILGSPRLLVDIIPL